MGRDVSIIGTKEEALTDNIRAIISSDILVDTRKDTVEFDLNPKKVLKWKTLTFQ